MILRTFLSHFRWCLYTATISTKSYWQQRWDHSLPTSSPIMCFQKCWEWSLKLAYPSMASALAHMRLNFPKAKVIQCNNSVDNDRHLYWCYWDNITIEECDKPIDYFYHSLSAKKQDQFNYYMDRPELQHTNLCDICVPKHEKMSQAFNHPSSQSTSCSKGLYHYRI